jgi:hypothetical protein
VIFATVVMLLCSCSQSFAAEKLAFLPWPFGLPVKPEIEGLLQELYSPSGAHKLDRANLAGVPVDMDYDGTLELVVAFVGSGHCGARGCSGYVLQGSNETGWRVLTDTETLHDGMIVTKDVVVKYRALIGPYNILVWNGVQFFLVCGYDECRETFDQGVKY